MPDVQRSLKDRYDIVRQLGNGSHGHVYLCFDKLKKQNVAVKTMPRSKAFDQYTESEFVNHSKLAKHHPHVIQYEEVFADGGDLCLAMEYASGGTILQYINRCGPLRESEARTFFQQLMMAIDFCHKSGVAIRDIKLENALLQAPESAAQGSLPDSSWFVKICDFGFSKSDSSAMKSLVGTLVYIAPEVLRGNGERTYNGKAADIWSCGIMLYIMLTASYPYKVHSQAIADDYETTRLLELMDKQQFHIPENIKLPEECHKFLMGLLQPNPANRFTMDEIFCHPWFKDGLPPGLQAFNQEIAAKMLADHRQAQRIAAIQAVLQEARQNLLQQASLCSGSTQREHEDRLIDAEISLDGRR